MADREFYPEAAGAFGSKGALGKSRRVEGRSVFERFGVGGKAAFLLSGACGLVEEEREEEGGVGRFPGKPGPGCPGFRAAHRFAPYHP